MSVITGLRDELADAGLRLRKAAPRGDGRLRLELDGVGGRLSAGQWHADRAETARVAALMADRFGDGWGEVLAGGRLLVQHGGADRKLSPLHRLVARPGARLVAHRPERRAVVRLDDRYVKVVRPGRTAAVVVPLREIRPPGVRVPRVLGVDDRRGLVTLETVTGRTLLELLADPAFSDDELETECTRTGVAVRALHSHQASPRRLHDSAAEVLTAQRWLEAASRYGLLDPDRWAPLLDRARSVLAGYPQGHTLLHRDLHDKQVILGSGEPVGLIDLDLAAYGDPALDLANLLVHLELRTRQGVCSRQRAARASAALVAGYSPDAALVRRLDGYAASARLRLAGIYAFRPAPPGLTEALIDDHDHRATPWL